MRTLSLSLLACLLTLNAAAQAVKLIRLNPPKSRTGFQKVRVVDVVDDRGDTAVIGTMRAGLANRIRPVGLEGGVAGAFRSFLDRYQSPAPDAAPVTLHIRQLEVSEKVVGMKERLNIQYSYAFAGEYGELAYEGSAFAESNMDVSPYIERLVRESLSSTFDKVAEAWREPAAGNAAVKVNVKIEPQPASTGLISYDRARPLGYEDFKGQPDDLSKGSAATYWGISFAYAAQQTGTEFKIIVTLSAIADPGKSWMRAAGRSAKVLSHENLHFAITAMMTCRLADSLRAATVTKNDYDSKLRQVFSASDRQLEQMQRSYDQETVHGTRQPQQSAWEEKIYGELKRKACYGY